MKIKNLFFAILFFGALFSFVKVKAQSKSNNEIQGPPQRTCGTLIPPPEWEVEFQKQIQAFIAANPNTANAKGSGNNTQAVYTIPVIIHVIHSGQAVGTFPNLAQGQLNSQVQVLNDDFAGVGQNIGNYPANAFTAWATNTIVSAASKDGLGRIKIANTGVTFCLALQDSLGNVLPEPGIDRINSLTMAAPLTGTFTSKNPAAAVYNTSGKFTAFIDGYIKPNTIWNVSKYMNIWVTDEQAAVGLLGYATFPVLSTLTGIPSTGTNKTDGFWSWAASFGSKTIFPGGTYSTGYDLGRTCTHEIGHWVGLRHIWGDGACLTDYCNDTPPASAANYNNCPVAYPLKSGSCAGPPSNSPNGEMFMNFMDYTYDCAMFMFTEDQRTRLQTAMANSPYRKFLGTHGLCSVPPPVANFSISSNPICAGQTATITDMSTGSPGAWSYTMTGGAPATSTLQSPSVTYASAGVYSITLVASNGGGSSAPVVKTITVNAIPSLTVTPSPATICAGGSSTITASGATTYTWNTGATTANIVVSPTVTTTYTVVGANGSCTSSKTVQVVVSGALAINIAPASSTICAGGTVLLTGSGATTYTWNTGPNTATLSVSPLVTTVYTLQGTTGTCTGNKTATVNVNPLPTVTITANPVSICAGNSSTLTASASAPGPWTYTWSTGANTAAITSSVPAVYTASVTNANGCKGVSSFTLSASPSPTVTIVASPTAVCAGSSSTLTASGAVTYTWNTGATSANITVTPTITTTYTVTGTNAGGCTNTKTLSVTVNALPTININPPTATVCIGSSTTLFGSGAATYTWNTGATTANLTVTPAITTSYTLSGTNAAGCTASKTTTVTVNPLPVVTITANPTSICAGGSSTLTASGTGGGPYTYTWSTAATTSVITTTVATVYTATITNGNGCKGTGSFTLGTSASLSLTATSNPTALCAGSTATLTVSGATSYTWNTGATAANIAVTPSVNTTYSVIGTNGTCSGTTSILVNVNANPTVTATSSTPSICAGNNVILSAVGATTYTWNPGSLPGASVTVSTAANTTYTVVGSNAAGCTNTKTVSVNVIANPTVNAVATATSLCTGSSATLTASGATTYTWNTGATSANIVVTPTVNTTYTVTGSNAAGCSNVTTIAIAVGPSPTVTAVTSSSLLCVGQTVTLTASGATNYTWSTGATTPVTTDSPTITTTYTVTGANGTCMSTDTITQAVSLCTGVEQIPVVTVNYGIFPNPNNGDFTVSLSAITGNTFIEVYNTIGQLISRNKLISVNTRITMLTEADGVYHVKIIQDGQLVYKTKLVKAK